MNTWTDLKLMAEHAIGWTDMSLAPDVVLALITEIESLRADAGRYAWIRANQYDALEIIEHWSGEQMNYTTDEELDAAIDAALAK